MFRAKGNKYGNAKRIGPKGEKFDSALEEALFHRLTLEERGGRISNLKSHPGTLFLGPARIQFRPDFSYSESGKVHYAEAKGRFWRVAKKTGKVRLYWTDPKWASKKKNWAAFGPGPLHVWSGTAAKLEHVETIIPKAGTCPTCGKPLGGSE